MAKNEPDDKKTAPAESAATVAAKQLKPEETKPVKRATPDISGLHIGDMVEVQLAPCRRLRNPAGGFYDPLEVYTLRVTVSLLRRLRHGDWLLYTQPTSG